MSFKPSVEERKWAMQLESDVIKRSKEDLAHKKTFDKKLEIRCPNDNNLLEEKHLDHTGISISTCPYCGGAWINRRNLELLYHATEKAESFIAYLARILNIEILKL